MVKSRLGQYSLYEYFYSIFRSIVLSINTCFESNFDKQEEELVLLTFHHLAQHKKLYLVIHTLDSRVNVSLGIKVATGIFGKNIKFISLSKHSSPTPQTTNNLEVDTGRKKRMINRHVPKINKHRSAFNLETRVVA